MRKLIFIFISILLIGMISAIEVSYCCEKTKDNLWCINRPQSNCSTEENLLTNLPFKIAPTSCESTTYCKLGTCINIDEGTCSSNSPQSACTSLGGYWEDKPAQELAQCQLGCCLVGDGAAYTTQTRCKRLATEAGVNVNFRTDVVSEGMCIDMAKTQKRGACVLETEYEKTCKMTTKEECKGMQSSSSFFDFSTESGVTSTFYEGRLCTDEELATSCGKSKETTCVDGKDEVYYLDTCGNIANIYDLTKYNDLNYWKYVEEKKDSCELRKNSENELINADKCGNCEYLAGSICKADGSKAICEDLSCEYDTNGDGDIDNNEYYQHGERWCAESPGVSSITIENNEIKEKFTNPLKENLPGSRYYRLSCYNGEVMTEPCADYRQEVCIESLITGADGEFRNAMCRINSWQTCLLQDSREDCEDSEIRDCMWINTGELKKEFQGKEWDDVDELIDLREDILGVGDASEEDGEEEKRERILSQIKNVNGTRTIISKGKEISTFEGTKDYNPAKYFQYICVPRYAPGFEFWNPDKTLETGEQIIDTCQLASASCEIGFESGQFHEPDRALDDCKNNCHCLPEDGPWLAYKQAFCLSLGDCGYSINYIDESGSKNWNKAIKAFGS